MFARLAIPLLLFLVPRFLPRIIRFARVAWRLSFDKRVPLFLRLLLPLAVLYVISPIDLLKDTIPIVGRFDDLLVLGLSLLFLTRLSPKDVVDEHSGNVKPTDRPEDKNPEKVVDGKSRLIDDE